MRSPYKKRKIICSLSVAALMVAALYVALPSKTATNSSESKKASKPAPIAASDFNKSMYPTDEAASLWAVVNKGRALPPSYIPAGLVTPGIPLRYSGARDDMMVRSDTAGALETLVGAARTAGYSLRLVSGYRSYSEQAAVYAGYVKVSGQAAADTFSARPGHSEHQTGLAADLGAASGNCELDQCFGDTPEGKWLALNAHKYGFIIRYQKNTQNLTGYEYEPWHVRYVGVGLAAQLNKTNQTLEQFFGLPIYNDYQPESLTLKT